MNQPASPRARFGLLLDVLTFFVLCGAVGLYFTTRRSSAESPTPAPSASLDSSFAPFRVVDSTDRIAVLAPSSQSRGLLLFVFKSDCPACGAQKPEWNRLAGLARARAVDVVGVTLEPLTPAVRSYFPGVPAVRVADPGAALRSLQLTVVPATILITDRGRIAFHAVGLLDSLRTRLLEGIL